MRHFLLVSVILYLVSSGLSAQTIKGKITNQSGDPVPYATVYIEELRQGTTSNTKGDYEIRLPAGKYTVIYQSLGFDPVYENINLSGQIIKNVTLSVQYYQIPEVRISATGEDPAYSIMRKAIGMAPYYLNNVSYYKAEVYLKGNLVIKRIPKLLQKSMKVESGGNSRSGSGKTEEKILKAGDSFLMESYNVMEFNAPDKYTQRVISSNSNFPSEGNEISPMSFIEASFYQPVLADMAISPLSPAAFSHYKFKYLGATPQGNFTINKIQVIPKRKSQQLFEGTIYIIEDLWCIQSVDLTNENLVGKIRIQQLYIPGEDNIWMPVSHKFEINIGIIGFKADAGYGSSVKYLDVKPNTALQPPKEISAVTTKQIPVSDSIPGSKSKKQIEKILEKDKLTNRDMIRLSRLMDKESKNSLGDSAKKSLEIKDHTTHIIEKDANKKDSAYWAQIRPIPLSDIEIKSLRISDSTKAASSLKELKKDTISSNGNKPSNNFLKTLRQTAFGHTWSDTTGFSFNYGGLLDIKNLSFNTVDGFIYGIDLSLNKNWNKSGSFYFSPKIMWAFSREKFMWNVYTYYKFNNLKHDQVYIRTGITSKDINNNGGINTFLNSVTTLFLKKNYLKLYESRFLSAGYMTEISNGLNLELSANYEDRRVLQNTTKFSVIRYSESYTDNVPVNEYLSAGSNPVNALSNQKHFDIVANVIYTPYQKYRIYKGKKSPSGSDWPTFDLTWEHGINKLAESNSKTAQFDMFRFEAFKKREIGAFSEFRWNIRTGAFLDNRNVSFYDFFHFNSQSFPVLLNNYDDAFMLPAYYSMSTPELFGEVHMKYTTPYLLLKLLPVLSNTLIRENLSVSYLGSRFHKSYTEIGYSLSEIFFIAEIGVYVGFEDVRYKSIGGKLIFKFN